MIFPFFLVKPHVVTPHLSDSSDEESKQMFFLMQTSKNLSRIITKYSRLSRALKDMLISDRAGFLAQGDLHEPKAHDSGYDYIKSTSPQIPRAPEPR